jgi:hypothetical protein
MLVDQSTHVRKKSRGKVGEGKGGRNGQVWEWEWESKATYFRK